MAYKEYFYGEYKKEILALFRKRYAIMGKVNYHTRKAKKYSEMLPDIEKKINEFLEKAKGKK